MIKKGNLLIGITEEERILMKGTKVISLEITETQETQKATMIKNKKEHLDIQQQKDIDIKTIMQDKDHPIQLNLKAITLIVVMIEEALIETKKGTIKAEITKDLNTNQELKKGR